MNLLPIIAIVFFISISLLIAKRMIKPQWPTPLRWFSYTLLVILTACAPLSFALRGSNSIWQILSNYGFGLLTLLVFFTVLREIVLLFTRALPKTTVTPERRAFLRDATRIGALGATASVFGYGATRALAHPTLHRVDITIKGLSPEHDGLTIAQLSDVHVGQLVGEPEFLAKIVEAVNGADVDILALTGDFVDGSVSRLKDRIMPLAGLRSKYGAFFVTGNHEYYSGADEWVQVYRSMGWDVLDNEHRVLNINGKPLILGGVPDLKKSDLCDPKAAFNNAPDQGTRLLLAHHPSTASLTDGLNIDLQLSGHTHAGQYFPATWIVQWVHQYSQGLNHRDDMQIYVNSGTGYWGPAIRTTDIVGEITLITLKAG